MRRLAKQEEERRKELELAAKDPTYLEVINNSTVKIFHFF